jgi:hypothetical protein
MARREGATHLTLAFSLVVQMTGMGIDAFRTSLPDFTWISLLSDSSISLD